MNILNYLPQLGLKPNLVNGMLFSSFASGSVAPFSPASVPGLQLWLDAEQGLFTTSAGSTPAEADGDPVGRWEDQSGNGYHLTQLGAAARPTLKLAIQNGKPVVRFDGVDDVLINTVLPVLAQPVRLFIVAIPRTVLVDGTLADDVTGNKRRLRLNLDSAELFAGASLVDGTMSANTAYLFDALFNGAGSSLQLNSGVKATGNAGTSTGGGLTLCSYGALGVHWSQADVAEVLVCQPDVSAGELLSLRSYLGAKWGVATTFSPASIPGLQLWLDAEQGLYQTTDTSTPATADGDPVGRWSDQSGNSRHVLQATAAARPTLKLGILGGKPVLRFDGVDDLLANTGYTLPAVHTAFLVYTNRTGTNGSFLTTENANGPLQRNTTVFPDASANFITLSSPLNSHQLITLASDYTADNYFCYLDGLLRGSTTTPGSLIGTGTYLGARGAVPNEFLTGDLAEVLAYNSILSSTDRQAVEEYLATKWGISV